MLWIGVATGLDLAIWSAVRHVPMLHKYGFASALALCFVHPFVLPPLFGRPWAGALRTVGPIGVGVLAAPLALLLGYGVGVNAGALGFLVMVGLSAAVGWLGNLAGVLPPNGRAFYAVQDVLGTAWLWSAFAIGTAVAALTAVGLSALLPGAWRQRLSWRVALAGAWASVLVGMPDDALTVLSGPWREPELLLLAAVPVAALVNRDGLTRRSAFDPPEATAKDAVP